MKVEYNNINNLKKGICFYKKNQDLKYHIVDIIKDKSTELVIYKWYGKHKQWWHYEISELWEINLSFEYSTFYFKK
jgi:hypothetical protein